MNTNSLNLPVYLPGTLAPTRIWAPLHEVDYAAQNQIRAIAELPWVDQLAIMPDVHAGKSVPVGSVIAMNAAVSPAMVGVDIGCGMMAIKTNVTCEELPDDLHALRLAWESVVPVGLAMHDRMAGVMRNNGFLRRDLKKLLSRFAGLSVDVSHAENTAVRQCGTLGGGNHFIELCADAESSVWITLHSGSRGIGKELAERHIARARNLDWNTDLRNKDLAVFVHRDESGHVYQEWSDYLHDLYWAQEYAAFNRRVMMASVVDVMKAFLPDFTVVQQINCHHNYVSEETHDGVDLVITRKGAISAQQSEWGIIPGSMGTGCYIVRGLGNPASFCSASHGAGRTMSRGAARRAFDLADVLAQTAGVECRKDVGVVDEIPAAYKDVHQVLGYESDLVEAVAYLDTLLCVKG